MGWGEDDHDLRARQQKWGEEKGLGEVEATQSIGLGGHLVSGASSEVSACLGMEVKATDSCPHQV